MLKTLIVLIIIAVGGSFLINHIPQWKQKVIETVNPAAKEARLLNDLAGSLNEIESNINQTPNPKNQADLKTKITSNLTKAKNLLKEAAKTNEQNSGIISSTLGKIVDSFIDKTPFPADHIKLIDQNSGQNPLNNCPTTTPKPN